MQPRIVPPSLAPRASVIIPNWNGARLLEPCLRALARQTVEHEVIVVDNGSTDDSLAVAARFPGVRLVPLRGNYGFCRAVNLGIRVASAPVIALLNNDAEPEPGWLAALLDALERHPEAGSAASKILLRDRPTVLHSAGDGYGADGIPVNRGVWQEDRGQFDREEYVFAGCGAGVAYRRELFERVGLFDERLFAYCEDVDLGFRAQLAGLRCVYVPSARVYHRLSATGGGPIASYYCARNFLWVMAKNWPAAYWRAHCWRALVAQGRLALKALRHAREPAARACLRGQLAGLLALPAALRARAEVRRDPRVTDAYLLSLLEPR